MEPTLCYIRESYFQKNSAFQKLLDTGNTAKQSRRTHLCLKLEMSGNKFYIEKEPLYRESSLVNFIQELDNNRPASQLRGDQ